MKIRDKQVDRSIHIIRHYMGKNGQLTKEQSNKLANALKNMWVRYRSTEYERNLLLNRMHKMIQDGFVNTYDDRETRSSLADDVRSAYSWDQSGIDTIANYASSEFTYAESSVAASRNKIDCRVRSINMAMNPSQSIGESESVLFTPVQNDSELNTDIDSLANRAGSLSSQISSYSDYADSVSRQQTMYDMTFGNYASQIKDYRKRVNHAECVASLYKSQASHAKSQSASASDVISNDESKLINYSNQVESYKRAEHSKHKRYGIVMTIWRTDKLVPALIQLFNRRDIFFGDYTKNKYTIDFRFTVSMFKDLISYLERYIIPVADKGANMWSIKLRRLQIGTVDNDHHFRPINTLHNIYINRYTTLHDSGISFTRNRTRDESVAWLLLPSKNRREYELTNLLPSQASSASSTSLDTMTSADRAVREFRSISNELVSDKNESGK